MEGPPRFPHFIPFGQKTWSPWAILLSDQLKLKKISSETRRDNELLLCRNDVWEILYKISIFRADHTTNVATIGSSCLWLANLKQSSKIILFGGKQLWKVLYKVYLKKNYRWATQSLPTEPLIYSLYNWMVKL